MISNIISTGKERERASTWWTQVDKVPSVLVSDCLLGDMNRENTAEKRPQKGRREREREAQERV